MRDLRDRPRRRRPPDRLLPRHGHPRPRVPFFQRVQVRGCDMHQAGVDAVRVGRVAGVPAGGVLLLFEQELEDMDRRERVPQEEGVLPVYRRFYRGPDNSCLVINKIKPSTIYRVIRYQIFLLQALVNINVDI